MPGPERDIKVADDTSLMTHDTPLFPTIVTVIAAPGTANIYITQRGISTT